MPQPYLRSSMSACGLGVETGGTPAAIDSNILLGEAHLVFSLSGLHMTSE